MRRQGCPNFPIEFSVAAIVFLSVAVVSAENWTQWRGPRGTGITTDRGAATEWDGDRNIVWRRKLSEAGNSTPIVWNDRLFVTMPISEGNHRKLMCLSRKTGETLWEQSVAYEEEEATHRTNPYCSPSPATDGERVIVWFGSAGLHCYDMEGERLWRRDLGAQRHMWGHGTSPILYRDVCILNFGPGSREMLLGIDKRTGDTIWEVPSLDDEAELELSGRENDGNASPREEGASRADALRGSWGTPIVLSEGGRDELVVMHPRRVAGYNPLTGQRHWVCGGYAPLAYVSPMYGDGHVVALGGYYGASLGVRPGGEGNVTESLRVWHKPRDSTWLGTGIIHEGYAYLGDMRGVVHCLDVETGEDKWHERLDASSGNGGSWSSLTMSGEGLCYLLNQAGDTFVFRPSPKAYDQVARNSLDEPTNSSVVIVDADIFIRTHEAIWCIRPE